MLKKCRIMAFLGILILCLLATTFPAFAVDGISSFRYDNSCFSAYLDGYDSYALYQYSSWYYIFYFNDADAANWSLERQSSTNTHIAGLPSGLSYYRFTCSADAFSYAAYSTQSCNCDSLIDKKATTTANTNDLLFKTAGCFFTNSANMSKLVTDYGLTIDDSYYIYFNNVDSKQYCIFTVQVSNEKVPVTVISPSSLILSSGLTLTLANSNEYFYIFHSESIEDCVSFLRSSSSEYINSLEKSNSISGVTRFFYSSSNIIDSATNEVIFYATSPDASSSSDISGDQQMQFEDYVNNIVDFFNNLGVWFSWMPDSMIPIITAAAVSLGAILLILLVLKLVHG